MTFHSTGWLNYLTQLVGLWKNPNLDKVIQHPIHKTTSNNRFLLGHYGFDDCSGAVLSSKHTDALEKRTFKSHHISAINTTRTRTKTRMRTRAMQPKQTLQQHAISTEAPGAPWYNKPSCWQWTFVSTEAKYGWRSMIGKDLRCQGDDSPLGFLSAAVSSELRSQFVIQLASCSL